MRNSYTDYIIYWEKGEYGSLPIRDSNKASEQIDRLNNLLDAVVVGIYNLLTNRFHWRLPLEEQSLFQEQIMTHIKEVELADDRMQRTKLDGLLK
jgi:hypothetical protein